MKYNKYHNKILKVCQNQCAQKKMKKIQSKQFIS